MTESRRRGADRTHTGSGVRDAGERLAVSPRERLKHEIAGLPHAEQVERLRPPLPLMAAVQARGGLGGDVTEAKRSAEAGQSAPDRFTAAHDVTHVVQRQEEERESGPKGCDPQTASCLDEPESERASDRGDSESEGYADALQSALVHLDIAQDRYESDLPPLLDDAAENLDGLIAGSIESITRLQSWVSQENAFFLTLFQVSHLETLLHAGASTLVGLLPGPMAPLYGFVYSALSGVWSGQRQSAAMEQAESGGRWLAGRMNTTTDAVLRYFMEDQASHVRAIAEREGALRQIFRRGGGRYADVRENIEDALSYLDAPTADENPVRARDLGWADQFFAQAASLFGQVHENLDDLAVRVADLEQAASRAPQVGELALSELLDLYTVFRTSRPVFLGGSVRGPSQGEPDRELFVNLRNFTFGQDGEISSNLREHLMDKSLADFARISIPVAADLWVMSHSFSANGRGAHRGRRWREPLNLWHGPDGSYSPTRPAGQDPRLVGALAALVDPELETLSGGGGGGAITEEEAGMREARSAQIALSRLWNQLTREPLSSHWSG